MKTPEIILAIESAVAGGSLSLLQNGLEIGSWSGNSDVSRAEDLLANIDELITSAHLDKHDVDLVAVSAGPGSFTGIRIGIATALGIKVGLGIKLASVSALVSMAEQGDERGRIITALPVGRNAVCIQTFDVTETGTSAVDEPRSISEETFHSMLDGDNGASFFLHPILMARLEQQKNASTFHGTLARMIGLQARSYPDANTEPLFISKGF